MSTAPFLDAQGSGLKEPGVTVIGPSRWWQRIDPRLIWRYRDLLLLLALRDIKVRYKQTLLGAGWAILQPLLTMGVLSVIFGTVLNLDRYIGSVPYPLFLYSGLLPWLFFSATIHAAATSLLTNAGMLQKVYFPRIIAPLAAIGAPLVDMVVAIMAMLALMIWFDVKPTWTLGQIPLALLTLLCSATGIGTFLAAVTASYRDFRHVVPFMLQVWFFLTPIIVPQEMFPRGEHWLWYLNPACGGIEMFRQGVLGLGGSWNGWVISTATGIALLGTGLGYFAKVERRFADVL